MHDIMLYDEKFDVGQVHTLSNVEDERVVSTVCEHLCSHIYGVWPGHCIGSTALFHLHLNLHLPSYLHLQGYAGAPSLL